MKQAVNPAIAGVIIAIVAVLVVLYIGWSYLGPRTDGPSQPINMADKMGKDKVAPPANKGAGVQMGVPK
jgi:hypothetical protein